MCADLNLVVSVAHPFVISGGSGDIRKAQLLLTAHHWQLRQLSFVQSRVLVYNGSDWNFMYPLE